MLQRPYTEFQTAFNCAAATWTREISKKRRLFLTNPVLLEFGGPCRTRKSFHVIYKTVIASRDVAEAIYGVLDCFQLRSGNMDTSNFKKLRLFQTNFKRCCKDQKRSFRLLSTTQRQHGHEKFQKKLRLFRESRVTGICPPTADPQTISRPL